MNVEIVPECNQKLKLTFLSPLHVFLYQEHVLRNPRLKMVQKKGIVKELLRLRIREQVLRKRLYFSVDLKIMKKLVNMRRRSFSKRENIQKLYGALEGGAYWRKYGI